jgi:hypothetical protein
MQEEFSLTLVPNRVAVDISHQLTYSGSSWMFVASNAHLK